MAHGPDHQPGRDELLDHDADGIREFDNALPRWWLYGFYLTIAFSIVYLVNYHVLPKPLFGHPGMVAEYHLIDLACAVSHGGFRSLEAARQYALEECLIAWDI